MRDRNYKRTRRALRRSLLNAADHRRALYTRYMSVHGDTATDSTYKRAIDLEAAAEARLRRFNRLHEKG